MAHETNPFTDLGDNEQPIVRSGRRRRPRATTYHAPLWGTFLIVLCAAGWFSYDRGYRRPHIRHAYAVWQNCKQAEEEVVRLEQELESDLLRVGITPDLEKIWTRIIG